LENLKKLSGTELEDLRAAAKAELRARKARDQKIERLRVQFERRLTKAGLTLSDLYPSLGTGKSQTRTAGKPKVRRKKRSVVKPKYKDPSGRHTWTGRGRSPLWVRAICERDGIDVTEFKVREKYRV